MAVSRSRVKSDMVEAQVRASLAFLMVTIESWYISSFPKVARIFMLHEPTSSFEGIPDRTPVFGSILNAETQVPSSQVMFSVSKL